MQGLFENSASFLAVANAAAGTTSIAAMPNRSFAIVNDAGTIQTGAIVASTSTYRVVLKTALGKLIYSPHFVGTKISFKDYTAYAPHIEQVSFLGYNGSTGAMDATAGQTFTLRIFLEWTKSILNNSALILDVPVYTTDATQKTLVDGLFDGVVALMARQPYPFINVTRVCDLASMSAFGTATIFGVTKGSQTVTTWTKAVAADVVLTASTTTATAGYIVSAPSSNGRTFTFDTITSVGHSVFVGSKSLYLASAGNASANGIALIAAINADTSGVGSVCVASGSNATVTITYRDNFRGLPPLVISDPAGTPTNVVVTCTVGDAMQVAYVVSATATAATFLLDKAWQGETGYVIGGTTLAKNFGTAAATGVSNWGLKFTSVRPVRWNSQTDVPYVGSFSLKFNNLAYSVTSTTAAVTDSIPAYDGSGTFRQIANQEAYAQFLNKQSMVQGYPSNAPTIEAVEGQNYDIVDISCYNDNMNVPTTGQTPKSFFNVRIGINSALATDVAAIKTVLTIS
jgi:hypothetical protein